ncbi:acyltransferase [Parasediminibacterium sp. JCM 36343]|uniref:acyltransferase n=1 Tax=Parasediminibacterium sp. JCM 36343 TaxID=3374279 RepID=UPI00397D051C
MKKLKKLFYSCRKSGSNFLIVLLKHIFYRAKRKNIVADHNAIIKGVSNIIIKGFLKVGISPVGFTHNKDVTLLNVSGKLEILGDVSIGRGCRFDIGNRGLVTLGNGTFINPFTSVVIMHKLEIGENCAISWNCQFLDEDFHKINYEGKKEFSDNGISIGNKVWIGTNVSIYKGTTIPSGCVIASNSVVKGVFSEENMLIAGNPAKILKKNISWEV